MIEAPRQARRIGYGRVSTLIQTEEPQRAALEAAGCNEIHIETICKLDRRARSLKALLAMAEELQKRDLSLQVLDQAMDTSTPNGS